MAFKNFMNTKKADMTTDCDKPLLSLCIPTNGNTLWVSNLLESIYAQKVDNNLFEVVITDNGKLRDLEEILNRKYNFENLHYYKSDTKGFLNQITCFKHANGVYRKMLNHRCTLLDGILWEMIKLIEDLQNDKPILYFSDSRIKTKKEITTFNGFDEFAFNLHYWNTWSGGVGIWDIDIDKLDTISINAMFPHISVIYDTREDSKCVIWNKKFQSMLGDAGKGGYDVFRTFAVDFIEIIQTLEGKSKIGHSTYCHIKQSLHLFLSELYYTEIYRPSHHTYIIKNIKESVCLYYGIFGYRLMQLRALLFFPKSALRIIKTYINNHKKNGTKYVQEHKN